MSKKFYKQGYRQSWETNPILKDWIQPVPDIPSKAYCRYCKRTLYAHRYSVLKHTCTIKHQQNVDKFKSIMPRSNENNTISQQNSNENQNTYSIIHQEDIRPENLVQEDEYEKHDIIPKEDESRIDIIKYTQVEELEILDEPCNQVVITTEEYLDVTDGNRDDSGNENQEVETDGESNQLIERNSNYNYDPDIETSSQNELDDMAEKKKTISTHILDTTRGQPATNVPVILLKLTDNVWNEISVSTTDKDGRVSELISDKEFTPGCYKLHFNVSTYLRESAGKSLYPFIEIVFLCEQGEHYHIPLLLNPFGYSTYRGS